MGAAEAIAFARAQIGKPYVFGAAGPNSYDCSGLVIKALAAGGHPGLPHWTGALIAVGIPVSRGSLQPGDMVFPDSGHVQLYSGNGMVIEAPHSGAFVRETKMWGFWQARRVFSPSEMNSTGTTNGPALTAVPTGNPLDVLGKFPVLGQLESIAGTLTNAGFWRRIGVFMLGVFLILAGVAFVQRRRIEQVAAMAGSTAVKAAVL